LQRCDFLKGKFALECKDYHDAIKFFLNTVKKRRIVIDGLIKKRALEYIKKIAEKIKKVIINKNYSNLKFNATFSSENNISINKGSSSQINVLDEKKSINEEVPKDIKFIEAIKNIIEVIKIDIDECNEKQLKDIIIVIDFNYSNKMIIDSYIDATKTILNNLTNKDRLGIILLLSEHRIICPIMCKSEIDIVNISKDLDEYSNKIYKKERFDSSLGNEIIQEKLEGDYSNSDNTSELNSNNFGSDDIKNHGIIIEDTIKSLNYCINYLKIKEINSNEKFFIYFTADVKYFMDYLLEINEHKNFHNLSYESEEKENIDLQSDKNIHFLLVGKSDNEENEDEMCRKILFSYFWVKK
jgi:hypothetical protein